MEYAPIAAVILLERMFVCISTNGVICGFLFMYSGLKQRKGLYTVVNITLFT